MTALSSGGAKEIASLSIPMHAHELQEPVRQLISGAEQWIKEGKPAVKWNGLSSGHECADSAQNRPDTAIASRRRSGRTACGSDGFGILHPAGLGSKRSAIRRKLMQDLHFACGRCIRVAG
jgi:hypothetical protein